MGELPKFRIGLPLIVWEEPVTPTELSCPSFRAPIIVPDADIQKVKEGKPMKGICVNCDQPYGMVWDGQEVLAVNQ